MSADDPDITKVVLSLVKVKVKLRFLTPSAGITEAVRQ